MKIALIGPGIMQIPTYGWGAVEILIWEYYQQLSKKGHDVSIVNKMRNSDHEQKQLQSHYCQELIKEINDGSYDFVHFHYDCLFHLIPHIKCANIGFTSHYPYINQVSKHIGDGFSDIFDFMIHNDKYSHFVLSQKDMEYLITCGANPQYIHKLENGIDIDNINFNASPGSNTIYLGKITDRKNQHLYCNLENIDIIGPSDSVIEIKNYKGTWSRADVCQNLTTYGNLLLISNGEADPLVVKEALSAGLGIVINSECAKNLEYKPFITILDNNRVQDLEYVQEKLEENMKISNFMREDIRKYAINKFSWNVLIEKYLYCI